MPKVKIRQLVFEQVFTWNDPSGKRALDFFIEPLLVGIYAGSIPYEELEVTLDPTWVGEWLVKRELDLVHVAALTQAQIDVPVLGAWMDDGSVLLIDGGHRYMARYLHRLPTVTYHILAEASWRKHAIITKL